MQQNIALDAVESRQIAAIGHNAQTNTLAVRFKNYKGEPSSLYTYDNVTADEYQALKSAESIGGHFNQNIKPHPDRYPYKRVEDRPVEGADK